MKQFLSSTLGIIVMAITGLCLLLGLYLLIKKLRTKKAKAPAETTKTTTKAWWRFWVKSPETKKEEVEQAA